MENNDKSRAGNPGCRCHSVSRAGTSQGGNSASSEDEEFKEAYRNKKIGQ